VGTDVTDPDLSTLYRETRDRLTTLLSGLDEAALATPVPACPRWAVRDVVAHLAAITEDARAGRLTGPPGEEETAAQVARLADLDMAGILALWEENAPEFEKILDANAIWPGVIDIASHEQDIRGALGRPGARDCRAIRQCAGRLLGWLRPPVPMRIEVEDAGYLVGPGGRLGRHDATELTLATTRFEAFRWRMGRRSRAQLAALDWSADPAPVLDHLVVFGPSPADIVE
jgi:uncharacterized protein (TIGR03083 family)